MKINDVIMAIATLSALLGTYLNLLKDPLCFILWACANTVFLCMALFKHDKWTTVVFSSYLAMAVVGFYSWNSPGGI